jgi:hypothetical protein
MSARIELALFAGGARLVSGSHAEESHYAGDGTRGDAAALTAVLQRLHEKIPSRTRGAALYAQLGMAHAHIALMQVEGAQARELLSGTADVHVHAWVRDMLHLEPESQVIRWRALERHSALLVSCIDRGVFESIEAHCSRNGLRFVSCKPAMLAMIGADQKTKAKVQDVTLAWTECAKEDAPFEALQLLRLRQGELSAAWRGWVPSCDREQRLDGAIRRFLACHDIPADRHVRHLRWPDRDSAKAPA